MAKEVVDLKFLIKLELKGENHVIHWCMKNNLMPVNVLCPKCGQRMRIYARKHCSDGYTWRCRGKGTGNYHDVERTLKRGSWFSKSHLPASTILKIMYMWFQRLPNAFIKSELQLGDVTVVDWKMFCRKVCQEICRRENGLLGGPGVVVEIGENKFNKRRIDKGPCTEGIWIVGGMERETSKCFFKVTENQTKQNLLRNLKENISPGSIIVSDCWRAYDCLSDEDFVQLEVTDGFVLKNPERSEDTTAIEKEWVALRNSLPCVRDVNDYIESYLAEYVWRKSNHYKGFLSFLTRIAEFEGQVSDSDDEFEDDLSDSENEFETSISDSENEFGTSVSDSESEFETYISDSENV